MLVRITAEGLGCQGHKTATNGHTGSHRRLDASDSSREWHSGHLQEAHATGQPHEQVRDRGRMEHRSPQVGLVTLTAHGGACVAVSL